MEILWDNENWAQHAHRLNYIYVVYIYINFMILSRALITWLDMFDNKKIESNTSLYFYLILAVVLTLTLVLRFVIRHIRTV